MLIFIEKRAAHSVFFWMKGHLEEKKEHPEVIAFLGFVFRILWMES